MHKDFKNGCPSCGYAVGADGKTVKHRAAKKIKKRKFRALRYGGQASRARLDADPLPLWVYGLVLLLGAVLAALFFVY